MNLDPRQEVATCEHHFITRGLPDFLLASQILAMIQDNVATIDHVWPSCQLEEMEILHCKRQEWYFWFSYYSYILSGYQVIPPATTQVTSVTQSHALEIVSPVDASAEVTPPDVQAEIDQKSIDIHEIPDDPQYVLKFPGDGCAFPT